MKRYTLTRGDTANLQDDPGQLAERIVEGEYANLSRFGVENFDLIDDDTGQLAEVKSTATEIGKKSRAPGRFRLWKKQHERLTRVDRDGSAWYLFLLYDVSERPVTARMVRKKPAAIGRQIGARGGWNNSGHNSGPQHKLPIGAVFE